MENGEPVNIPRHRIGGHSFPQAREWLIFRERSVRGRPVTVDDTVTPVRNQTRGAQSAGRGHPGVMG